jgi:glycosyltransferase involved in cell wall biosynthesis/SAM-dependent methyltransferase
VLSVIIPVRNGGDDLRRCLDAIDAQDVDEEVEVMVIDSESSDGSADLARAHGARVETIPVAEFNHGATRNLGAELSRGETLVFTSQDAYAERDDWLQLLTSPLRSDGELAGVYGRQLPHDHATPPERFFLEFLYGSSPRVQRRPGGGELSMRTTLFSNANAAVRRSAWEQFRFADDIIMSEDQEWAVRVLLAGWSLGYEPAAAVRHSHPYTLRTAFRRFFDSGVSAERAYLAGGGQSTAVLRREALRYAREELAWMVRNGKAHWIPYAVLYELTKYAGLQLGAHHERLPVSVNRRLSASPGYWGDGGKAEVEAAPRAAGAIELVDAPAPATCVACGAALAPWGYGEPQEPSLRRRYLMLECPSCGTRSTAGVADMELYETGVYEASTTRLSAFIEMVRRGFERQKLAFLRRAVPPPARIAEAGAGQGRFVAAARAEGYDAGGFEPSQRGVEVAAERGIELQRAGLEDAEIAPASLDALMLWHVLEHLDDPDPALERIAGWLKPGGALLLGVPNVASVQARIGGPRWLHLDLPRHRHHFTPSGLRALLERHGLRVEREHHVLLEHNPFGMWQAWLDRATTVPSYAYNLVKRNAKLNFRDLAATLILLPFAPLAAMVEAVAGLARRGGTIAVVARRV